MTNKTAQILDLGLFGPFRMNYLGTFGICN